MSDTRGAWGLATLRVASPHTPGRRFRPSCLTHNPCVTHSGRRGLPDDVRDVAASTVGTVAGAAQGQGVIWSQVSLPDATEPAGGSLWSQIMGPILPLLSDAWWVVLHVVMPLCLIGGVVIYILAAISGNKGTAARAKSAIWAVPTALFLMAAALLVSRWVISSYT
jgi:hypothetical protein